MCVLSGTQHNDDPNMWGISRKQCILGLLYICYKDALVGLRILLVKCYLDTSNKLSVWLQVKQQDFVFGLADSTEELLADRSQWPIG